MEIGIIILPGCSIKMTSKVSYYLPPELWSQVVSYLLEPIFYQLLPLSGNTINNLSETVDLPIQTNHSDWWIFLSQPPFVSQPNFFPQYQPALSINPNYTRWWFGSKVFYRHNSDQSRWKLARPYQLTYV